MRQTKTKIDWDYFKPIPGFDCVKVKNEIQARIYEETKNMTPEEEREYIRQKCETFDREVAEIRHKREKMEGGDTK